MDQVICARCYNTIKPEQVTWAVLTGGTVPVPTCYDDRLCIDRRGMFRRNRAQVKSTVKVVRELARRFAF